MSKTIALFGCTGSTGQHFLTLALETSYKVYIMVRDPSKVTTTNDNLTVIEGDFSIKVLPMSCLWRVGLWES
jgi:putative NADH-flavin reductase